MTSPVRPRLPAPLLAALALAYLTAGSHGAQAAVEIVAARGTPSSVSERYGPAIPIGSGSGGAFAIPTRTGVEVRGIATGELFGSLRTVGVVREAAWSATTGYLIAGELGIVAVDASDSTDVAAVGGHDHLGALEHGAFARAGGMLAVSRDSLLHFLRETSPGSLSLIETRAYLDGRTVVRIRARADSFLVLGVRESPSLRAYLTLFRARSGAMPESLWETPVNGIAAQDMTWPDAMAFLAAGNTGVVPFNSVTRQFGGATSIFGNLIRSVDADAGTLAAVGESRTYAQFTRTGVYGETLANAVTQITAIEPFHVAVIGGRAIVSEDEQVPPFEPDEIARSLIEIREIAQLVLPPITASTGTGRVRRVAWDGGLAYIADYTGGLRIYQAGLADTSLVGLWAPPGNARVYDIALDPARKLAYLAAGTAGLVVVDVTDPAIPVELRAVGFPGLASAVALAGPNLVAVARRGFATSGVTFVDVADSSAPFSRGSVSYPFVQDPRALAVKDTVAFVADELLGLFSIGFGNPDAPAVFGSATGFGARDLDLSGSLLIVGTRDSGVELVDVFRPDAPSLLSTLPTPEVFGVARQGETAVALLGDGGALAIDIRDPSAPRVRGMIAAPGFCRDAAWIGDTLLIAESFGLERFIAAAAVSTDPVLSVEVDPAAVVPRARISWTAAGPPGMIGWNVYRDRGTAVEGVQGSSWGVRVNDALLSPGAASVFDDALAAGTNYRYRLEAFFADGSSRKVAEGTLYTASNSALGRLYPNPYRPRGGGLLRVPYRVLSVDAGMPVRLRVFGPEGRLVRRILATAPAGGGFASLTWDGKDDRGRLVADGVYFIHLDGPGLDDARQIILLR